MAKPKKIAFPPKALLQRIRAVRAKRPRTVLEHILKHGAITTEELQNLYGYEHPPRAARDVRELGIPLITSRARDKRGRTIAAYRLDVEGFDIGVKRLGRKQLPKKLKGALIDKFGSACGICGGRFQPSVLQIDHRVPYEVGGEPTPESLASFMLLCGSCNRSKSWACEHCPNWLIDKRPGTCNLCYWGNPASYVHIALEPIRRIDVTWQGAEVADFDRVQTTQSKVGSDIRKAIKAGVRDLAQSNKAV